MDIIRERIRLINLVDQSKSLEAEIIVNPKSKKELVLPRSIASEVGTNIFGSIVLELGNAKTMLTMDVDDKASQGTIGRKGLAKLGIFLKPPIGHFALVSLVFFFGAWWVVLAFVGNWPPGSFGLAARVLVGACGIGVAIFGLKLLINAIIDYFRGKQAWRSTLVKWGIKS